MLHVQEQAMQATIAGVHSEQVTFQQQVRSNEYRQHPNPPKFQGRPDENLELWLFQIEEHFAAYVTERNSCDSRFVGMVIPFLGPDMMSWFREFKATLGDNPRTLFLIKQ